MHHLTAPCKSDLVKVPSRDFLMSVKSECILKRSTFSILSSETSECVRLSRLGAFSCVPLFLGANIIQLSSHSWGEKMKKLGGAFILILFAVFINFSSGNLLSLNDT
ncbi:hypothetical protein KUTeg_006956 [Tegillarca granosa]|uniref:Uncharacterized protein n=1 Tax=Tegillarca granosa TaxID=220873 RepID=A0ABQ9FDU5_TEGGR|nr:hypothetical protein KUTeg_006956 [Tegillarca granosa]